MNKLPIESKDKKPRKSAKHRKLPFYVYSNGKGSISVAEFKRRG
jgi:hypothetical protein